MLGAHTTSSWRALSNIRGSISHCLCDPPAIQPLGEDVASNAVIPLTPIRSARLILETMDRETAIADKSPPLHGEHAAIGEGRQFE